MELASDITIRRHATENRNGAAKALAVLVLSVGTGVMLPFALAFAVSHVPGAAALAQIVGMPAFKETAALLPIAMAGVTILCLALEASMLGYAKSTLYQIIADANPSIRNDLFFFFLRVSGVASLLALVMTLGTSFHAQHLAEEWLGFALLAEANVVLQFVALALLITFCNYWTHRLLHSPYFFEIHKVHHSAQFYGVLLPYRAHPLDHLLANIYTAGISGLLGFEPAVLVAWMAVNAFYQSMVHSRLDWPRWLEPIVITPAAHRIHHSTDPRHYNKNMSILTVWDVVFGTYLPPEPVAAVGVDAEDQPNFNTGRYVTEIFLCFFRWLGIRPRRRSAD